MEELISAGLARRKAAENTNEISIIKEFIQKSIDSGKFFVATCLKLSNEQIEYLQSRGYVVEETSVGFKISF